MSIYPVLFDSTATVFDNNGIGVLSDTVRCRVTKDVNGKYDLELTYPIDGQYSSDIIARSIIYADASPILGEQPFRVYNIIKQTPGTITAYAHHISYDMNGIPVPPFTAASLSEALIKIKTESLKFVNGHKHTFSLANNYDIAKDFENPEPRSMRACIMGKSNSILSVYGGEARFENFNTAFSSAFGKDRGYRIKYGVNLIDLAQEQNCADIYSGVYPYYKDSETLLELPATSPDGKIISVEGMNLNFVRILPLNLSAEFDETPASGEALREVAKKYIKDNNISAPKVSISLSHEELARTTEYSNITDTSEIEVGDTVYVEFIKLGITSSARVSSAVYDSLKHKYVRLDLGDARNTLVTTLLNLRRNENQARSKAAGTARRVAAVEKGSGTNAYVNIAITQFNAFINGSSIIEAGTEKTYTVDLSWKLNRAPTKLTLDGVEKDRTQTGAATAQISVSGITSKSWTLVATGEKGETSTRAAYVQFVNSLYYGSSTAAAPSEAVVLGLQNQELSSSHRSSFTVNAAKGEYIWYCVPKRFGTCTFVFNMWEGGFQKPEIVSVTNPSGFTEDYYCYRSTNTGLGDTTLMVTK